MPPIKNAKKNGKLVHGIHFLRTMDDAADISSSIKKGKRVSIIGAGLIGLEIAESLYKKGMAIIIIATEIVMKWS